MTDEKWQELVEMAQKNFRGAKLSTEDLLLETADGPQKRGTQDILVFDHPAGGRYKLVRENHPIVLEKKEFASHRQGDTARTEYKFSQNEFSHKLRVYKEVDFDEWEEVTLDKLGLV
jgi:hypothetical protein